MQLKSRSNQKKTVTSEGLHNYAPQVRGCYLRSERQLRFFNSYSQNKCELECVANYIKVKCGCVQFDMPSKWQHQWTNYCFKSHLQFLYTGDNATKVCQFPEFACSLRAKFRFYYDLKNVKQCECLPDCISIEYEFESSKTQHVHLESEQERFEKYNRTGYVQFVL